MTDEEPDADEELDERLNQQLRELKAAMEDLVRKGPIPEVLPRVRTLLGLYVDPSRPPKEYRKSDIGSHVRLGMAAAAVSLLTKHGKDVISCCRDVVKVTGRGFTPEDLKDARAQIHRKRAHRVVRETYRIFKYIYQDLPPGGVLYYLKLCVQLTP